ncbi:MAG TPA: hypothetical protein VFS25_01420 [Chitinophaga sp.]|uniref:hypothetical protein n=1 Tax=Chitinophaga sp. TaxID=1869181 RepID=UPI002DBD8505|nr:hypothetical protein [Chitinophaga sp.]HEU4551457.1 hypothetical protein [Chitinophaga sp.]
MAIAKNKVLLIMLGVLLFTNIGMLVLFLNLKPANNRFGRDLKGRRGLVEILEKKAGFSKQQLNAYLQLREQHWTKMKPLLAEMRNAKDSFYRLLYVPDVADSTLNRAAAVIGQKQQAIDLQTFRHFQQVRGLCTPAQRPGFDTLVHQVIYRMSAPFRRDSMHLRIPRR